MASMASKRTVSVQPKNSDEDEQVRVYTNAEKFEIAQKQQLFSNPGRQKILEAIIAVVFMLLGGILFGTVLVKFLSSKGLL